MVERDATEMAVPVRRCDGRRPATDSSSDGLDDDVCDEGGDVLSMPPNTRSHGARVRSVGPRSGRESTPASLSPSWRLGRVRAQFSQGPARRVTYSSYVLRNSCRCLCDAGPEPEPEPWGSRGLCGGVSIAEPAVAAWARSEARYVWASWAAAEAGTEELR